MQAAWSHEQQHRIRYDLQTRAIQWYVCRLVHLGRTSAWRSELSSKTHDGVEYDAQRDVRLHVAPSLKYHGLLGAFVDSDCPEGTLLAPYPCWIMRRDEYDACPFAITTAAIAPALTYDGVAYVVVGKPTSPAAQINRGTGHAINAKFVYSKTAFDPPAVVAPRSTSRRRSVLAASSSSSPSSSSPAASSSSSSPSTVSIGGTGTVYRDYIGVRSTRRLKANEEIFIDYGPKWNTSECFSCDHCLLKLDEEVDQHLYQQSVSQEFLFKRGRLYKCTGHGCRRGYHEECYRRQFGDEMGDTVECSYHSCEARWNGDGYAEARLPQ